MMTDLVFFRDLLKRFRARSGNGFRQFKICVIFGLAKVLRAKQFLCANNLRALLRGLLSAARRVFFRFAVGLCGASCLELNRCETVLFDDLFHSHLSGLLHVLCRCYGVGWRSDHDRVAFGCFVRLPGLPGRKVRGYICPAFRS